MGVISNTYQSSDGWVYVTAYNNAMWKRACEAFDKPEWLEDSRFGTLAGRIKHTSELEGDITDWFLARTTTEAVDHLSSFSIPCAPVNDVEQAAKDPHLHEREILVEVPDPIAGSMYVAGKMIKFSRTPMVVGSAPTVGEHTEEVLGDILGYSQEQIRALQDQEVVRLAGPATVPS